MDPDLLVGIVNTAIRNHYASLDDFCASNSIDRNFLCERLASGDYHYNSDARQFR